MKKVFKVAVEWAVFGTIEVEAESLEEAIKIANEDESIPLPEWEYIDGSFEVNEDMELQKFINDIKENEE